MSKNKEIAVNLEKLMYYPPSKGYALILVKKSSSSQEDGLKLPIIIGAFEAQAIALALEKLNMPRPLTHDLFANFLEKMEFKVNKIVVNDLVNGTFYAKIYMERDNDSFFIDSRPSDAIALALRVDADIYVEENVFNEAGQTIEIAELENSESSEAFSEGNQNVDKLFDLQMQLQKAIDNENYELAAKIRDKIADIEKSDEGPGASGHAEA